MGSPEKLADGAFEPAGEGNGVTCKVRGLAWGALQPSGGVICKVLSMMVPSH